MRGIETRQIERETTMRGRQAMRETSHEKEENKP